MSRHYKKLILLLIPACAGFCLALALGSAGQPLELPQEEFNKDLVVRALFDLVSPPFHRIEEFFDPNYIHHLPSSYWYQSDWWGWYDPNNIDQIPPQQIPLTLDETISWYWRDVDMFYLNYIIPNIHDVIAEGNKVVVFFDRELLYQAPFPEDWRVSSSYLSSEIFLLRIANNKLVEGWSVSDPASDVISQEEKNKALVKEAILAFDEDPYDANLPDQFDPNYVEYGPRAWRDGVYYPDLLGVLSSRVTIDYPFTFEDIFAEGDMVSVRVSWVDELYKGGGGPANFIFQLGMFRIEDRKIVEAWIARPVIWLSYD